MQLTNVHLVTDGPSEIGLGIAAYLAQLGAKIVFTGLPRAKPTCRAGKTIIKTSVKEPLP